MKAARLLVVVAHPDDETFGCGSLLLEALAHGVDSTVVCATRGEAGEPAPGSGVTREELGGVRERELRQAADLMGVGHVELLGFRDSGMDGEPSTDALVSTPVEAVAREVGGLIQRVRPHVVVTLDASDGHRDHAHIRDATLRAVEGSSWAVARVYLQCLPRSLLRRWAEHMHVLQPDSPYLDVDGAGLGTPDALVTDIVDATSHLEKRRAAIAIHASQTSPYGQLPPDLEEAFLATNYLRRVVPPDANDGGTPGIFAGLELGGVHDCGSSSS